MITNDDAVIGENLRRMREQSHSLTQDGLAKLMRRRGHAWKKQTVYNIEAGQRQLRLVEARDVLICLNRDPSEDLPYLLLSPAEWTAWKYRGEVDDAHDELLSMAEELAAKRYELSASLHPKDNEGNSIPCTLSEDSQKRNQDLLQETRPEVVIKEVSEMLNSEFDY